MEKKFFKLRSSSKQKNENGLEKCAIVEEKYNKLKDIFKQVLRDVQQGEADRRALREQCLKLAKEIQEKDDLLERMQSVSEAVVDEFSALKAKCDMEAETACNAMKRATKYLHENKILRGNLQNDTSLLMRNDFDGLSESNFNENLSEIEELNKTNSDLRSEVASMQMKLIKQLEKESSLKEEYDIIKKLYEDEMREHKNTTEKLKSLKMLLDSVVQAVNSHLNTEEITFDSSSYGLESDAVTENNNQSKAENSFIRDITATFDRIEKQRSNFRNRVKELEVELSNIKLNKSFEVPRYVPPPPPPPLPPQPVPFNPFKSLKAMINARKKTSRKDTSTSDEDFACDQQKAMSEVVEAIKKGSVKLKPVPKRNSKTEVNENEPAALIEMKNILKTLKKRENKEQDNCLSDVNTLSNDNSSVIEGCSPESSVGEGSKLDCSLSVLEKIAFCSSLENISVASASYSNVNGNEFRYSDLMEYDSFNIEDDNKDDCMMII